MPLIATVEELVVIRDESEKTLARVAAETGVDLHIPIGTMIELPRAAMTAGRIAEEADFFSFGTNDLTQTVWGFSRDDVEAAFFPQYMEAGIFSVSPFESIDVAGVGRMVAIAAWEGKETKPDLTSESAASTAATRTRSTSSTRSRSTTCPARRSGCRWPGWRRARATVLERAAARRRSDSR